MRPTNTGPGPSCNSKIGDLGGAMLNNLPNAVAGRIRSGWTLSKRFLLCPVWRATARVSKATAIAVLATVAWIVVANSVFSTPRDFTGYRTLDPKAPTCQQAWSSRSTLLYDVEKKAANMRPPDTRGRSTAEPHNFELELSADRDVRQALKCSIQTHEVPQSGTDGQVSKPLRYHLAFLEFTEAGEPYILKKAPSRCAGSGASENTCRSPDNVISQLDVLREHLHARRSNYVIAFIHGWRHTAAIGDDNVAGLRLHAAYVASFLAQRCRNGVEEYCDAEVTAIFIGWRGARVDELKLKTVFGDGLGTFLGTVATVPTLFDRKPVSEAIGPSVVSALTTIGADLQAYDNQQTHKVNHLITIGHSLGGNLLAHALRNDFVWRVLHHVGVAPPVGSGATTAWG
jgi:hypothetical protein